MYRNFIPIRFVWLLTNESNRYKISAINSSYFCYIRAYIVCAKNINFQNMVHFGMYSFWFKLC